jgi:hypothetical protein
MDLFDDEQVTTADQIKRPERALEKEAIDDFMKRNPMAGGGMLVQPGFGGTRQGYARDKQIKTSLTAEKIVSDYKKTIAKFSMKEDLSKAPSFENYINNKYGKNAKSIRMRVTRESDFAPRDYLQEQKLNLAEALKNKSNNSLKYEELGNKFILKKVGSDGVRAGQNEFTKKLYDIIYDLDSREDKVIKAFKYIIDENLPVKKITKGSSNLQRAGTIKSMIGQLTGINTVAPPFTSGLEKSYKLFAQNFDMTPKEFKESFKYLNQIAKQSNLINVPFDQAFKAATERVKGAAELGGSDMLTFYRDPNSNVVNYIFRHWDRNNFNKTGASRVKLYDRSKLKLVNGELIPKKGYTLDDIELKWESGKKYNVKDFAFSYDNSKLFDKGVLSTQGKASGLFDEVYSITKDYYSLYNKRIPDPKNPGKNIPFGEMMTRDYGKNSLAIGHNNPGGISVEPISNFELQTQKLNTGIYQSTKNFKNPTLKKRIIEELYGELYKFRGGEKYIDQLVKNPPDLSYSEALKNVILRKDFKTLPMSAQREVAIANAVKNMDLPEQIINRFAVLGGGNCGRGFKNQGGRVGLQDGTPDVNVCFRKAIERVRKGGLDFTKAESVNFSNLTKSLRAVGASNIMKFGVIPEALFEGALIADKMASEGDSFAQGLRNSYLAIPFQAMGIAKTYEEGRREEILNPELINKDASPLGEMQKKRVQDVFDMQDTFNERNKLVAQSQNLKNQIKDTDRISDGDFGYVGGSQDLQKRLSDTRADLQDMYRGDAKGDVRRAEKLLTTKPMDLDIKDQLTMDAYNQAVEKADALRAGNILVAPGTGLEDVQIKKRMKELPITPEYAKEQLQATGDYFGRGYTPLALNKLFTLLGRENPRFGLDETGKYSEEKGLNDYMNYLRTQNFADNFRDEKAGGGRAGFKIGSTRKGILKLIDESVKSTPKDITPDLNALIKKTLDEDFFDKKDRIVDTLNFKAAKERKNFPYNQKVQEEPDQLEFYDDITKSNFRTKTGPFFDRRKRAGGGILKQAGDRSGAMLESMNPDSQGLQGLMKRGIKT